MTPKQRRFARFLAEGMPPVAAAIAAGYSDTTASRKASQMADDPAIKAYIQRETENPTPKEFAEGEDFMRWLMNNDDEPISMRWKAANSLMTRVSPQKTGKKAQQMERAKKAVSKFAQAALTPPKLKH